MLLPPWSIRRRRRRLTVVIFLVVISENRLELCVFLSRRVIFHSYLDIHGEERKNDTSFMTNKQSREARQI